MGKEVFG